MNKDNIFDFLVEVKPELLAKYMEGSEENILALVLSYTDVEYISETLMYCEDATKIKVVIALSSLHDINEAVANTVASNLKKEFKIENETFSRKFDKNDDSVYRTLAKTIRKMKFRGQELLKNLNVFDNTLTKKIIDNSFLFEDIFELDAENLKKVIDEVGIEKIYISTLDNSTFRKKVDDINEKFNLNYIYKESENSDNLEKIKKDVFSIVHEMISWGRLEVK